MSRLHLQHNQTAIIKGINPCKVLPSVSGPWQAFNKCWLLSGWGEDNSKQSKTVPGAENLVQRGFGERGWSRDGEQVTRAKAAAGTRGCRSSGQLQERLPGALPRISTKTHPRSEMSVVLVRGAEWISWRVSEVYGKLLKHPAVQVKDPEVIFESPFALHTQAISRSCCSVHQGNTGCGNRLTP